MNVMEYDCRIIESALNHYSQRLRKLVDDPEIIPLISDYLKTDLTKEGSNVDELRDKIKKRQIYIDFDTETTIFSVEENKKIISNAFKSYLYDLTNSKNLIIKKLGGSSPKFEFVDKEISLCTNFLGDFK